MKYNTISDMGDIKIHNETMSCFFGNELGDGDNEVEIYNKVSSHNYKLVGHFTVKTKAYLSYSDCDNSKLYEFDKGRWFVYLKKPMHFLIEKVDDTINE